MGRQASMVEALTPVQYDIIYNCTSLGLASMMASTVFFFLRLSSSSERYKVALCFTGLVTFIAAYHYFRIFNSFVEAYTPCEVVDGVVNPYKCDADTYGYTHGGAPFNDAYRYVDWLLTVPLLLIELILVMKLPKAETVKLSWSLGVASAAMVALGYPGEIQDNLAIRWFWWAMAMIPFCYVVITLVSGLNDATAKQPDSVKGLVVMARYLTVISWLTYPGVYIIKNMGLAGNIATTYEQVGYSIADVVAKAVFGVLIWAIAAGKSAEEQERGLLG